MNKSEFYKVVRDRFGVFNQSQVNGFEAVLKSIEGLPVDHQSYLLATTWHETAATMQPIAEYGKGKGKKYGVPGKYGQVPYGRGYVQLTWDYNYEKADKALGLKGALLKDFNLAMQPTIAAQILVRGCTEGWFTGKKLSDYTSFKDMRRVVNGTDDDDKISSYAAVFKFALMSSGVLEFVPTSSGGLFAEIIAVIRRMFGKVQ
jgi:hypothetical protein